MATITELEDTIPGKLSFLNYVWAVFGYIIWIFSKPLVIFREFFKAKQVQGPAENNVQPEELILVRRERNWIDNCCHDNDCRHDLKNTTNSRVTSIGDVLKLLGGQFKQVFTGLYEPHQTPLGTRVSHVTVMNPLQSLNRTSYKPNIICEGIMAKLARLQDNGDFDAFDKCSSALLVHGNESPDIRATVLIEQSRSMLYQNRLARAKYLARTSLELATSTACPKMYIARACLVLSACYRAKGKLGKSKMFLDQAGQNLENMAYYDDWCRFYDAYGSYLNGISDTVTQPGETVLKKAKEYFFKQLQVAESCETRKKQQFYALLKIARTLLDANTIFGQQREVPDDDVTKAGEYLDKIEAELWDDVARGTHMQFLLIRVKQYYRQQRFHEAVVLLEKSIALTTGQGYERDRALMVDGLKMLKSMAELQKSEIAAKEKPKDTFDSGSEGRSHLESFDSGSDSVRVFDSEFDDSF